MSEDPIKTSIENLNEQALEAKFVEWRDALRRMYKSQSPEDRQRYKQEADEHHAEMEKLGHKHGPADG